LGGQTEEKLKISNNSKSSGRDKQLKKNSFSSLQTFKGVSGWESKKKT